MKKCLILFAIMIAALAMSILTERSNDEMPENTLAISKIGIENSMLLDDLDE